MTGKVIFIDDEKHLRLACSQSLELAGFNVDSFSSADGALDQVTVQWPGVIVSDVRMVGTGGMELMSQALDRDPEIPVILITGHGDVPMAVQAMREGAYDFIEKPFAPEVLVDAVRRALDKRYLVLENRELRVALESNSPLERVIVGQSGVAEALRVQVTTFAATDADVLVSGETGTGKELVARALHDLSPRSEEKFVPVNCGALPETIIESELFGHEKGAFTGASQTRIGKFEYADGGTLFLDEIESMPIDLQARLLRVLEDRTIVRLGANNEVPVDVRVIAATKVDLAAAGVNGTFRDDLYYRLNVLNVLVPPLRDRTEDILPLARHFVEQARIRFGRAVEDFDPATLACLLAHDWPGNLRELKNSMMRYALGQGLGESFGEAGIGGSIGTSTSLAGQVALYEAGIIASCLIRNAHKLKPTYEELGISRKTLYDKIRKYGIATMEIDVD
jgi:two-component system C4-dicarboxylate transport response regulator DctD